MAHVECSWCLSSLVAVFFSLRARPIGDADFLSGVTLIKRIILTVMKDHISSKNLQSKRGWRRLLTSCTRSLIMPNFGVLFSGSIISGTVRPQRSGYFCMSLVCVLAESNVLRLSSFLHSGELYRNHQREKNVENHGNFTFWASWFSDLRIHRFLFVRSE